MHSQRIGRKPQAGTTDRGAFQTLIACGYPGGAGYSPISMHSPGKRPIEYRQPEVDFIGLDGDRRGDAEYAPAPAGDAGPHAQLEAFPRRTLGAVPASR